jgi:hypothetical protein
MARSRDTNHLPAAERAYPGLLAPDAIELDGNVTRPLFISPTNTYISLAGLRSGYGDKRSV